MKNIFEAAVSAEVIDRINQLNPESSALWGKMNVAQMLAHCNVTYEMVYTDKHSKPNGFTTFMLKMFVKKIVTNDKLYTKNGRTAPAFLIVDEREFNTEKKQLVDYIKKTQELGEAHFDNKTSHSFGKLSKAEWNNMFFKHLDHHLGQFGV